MEETLLQQGHQAGFRRVMDEEFEVIVESKPLPDGEDRLRRVFEILLRPISNAEEEPCSVESDQVDLAVDDTPDVADSLRTLPPATPAKMGLYKTINRHYNK